ncbi:arrestin domain-containing protein 17-like [Calliphora vicina]|uniref:arrestin domain-containing protein 17-like n=1 Tax=Calliphora vicina TaxID=7373 RepID=UPI00325BF792
MPSTCEFQLNNPNAVYNSGDTVSGAIVLNTSAPKDIRDIRIIFRGEGKVSWTETKRHTQSGGTYTNPTIQFKANELYIYNTTTVRGEGTMPAGTHTYPFQILLPLRCASSGEGRYGYIRYELILKINRPSRFDNEFSKPLTVIKLLDLNLNPAFRIPIESEDIFSSSFCCFSNGTVNTTLSIPFGGYAIGQSVRYSVHVRNQSMDHIEGYTIEFNRKIIFTARTPHHKTCEDKTTLYRKSYGNRCLRFTTRIFGGNFLIVSTPPTTEGECIISVRYSLKVILNMVGLTTNNIMTVPIVIGTVPLRESMVTAAASENSRLITVAPTAPELLRESRESIVTSVPLENYRLLTVTPTAPELLRGNMVTTEPLENYRHITVAPTPSQLPLVYQRRNDSPPSYQELGPPSFEEATRSSAPFIDTDRNEHNRHIGFKPL